MQPIYIDKERKEEIHSRTNDYVISARPQDIPSLGSLPSSERYQPPSLPFSRYKDKNSGAVNPAMLLLTEKPFDYIRNNEQESISEPYWTREGPPPSNQIFFQEGATGYAGQEELSYIQQQQQQGSPPAEGSVDAPRTRPERPQPAVGPNRFRAPAYRPRRPGSPAAAGNNFQTGFGGASSQSPSPLLSKEVVLPPVDPNNPNFAPVVRNPNGSGYGRQPPRGSLAGSQPYDPYFPPN